MKADGWVITLLMALMPAAAALAAADHWTTDTVDEAWAARVLADPDFDQGWCQSCNDDWKDGRVSTCEVREMTFAAGTRPIAIDGGENSGMTVMGSARNDVRVVYRVRARARTAERAKELAESIHLERRGGWLRPEGPATNSEEWWSVEAKVWVPRSSDLGLRAQNGPVGVRSVRGTMEVDVVNGPVSLVDLSGAVHAHVENGPLHVELTGSRWTGAGLEAEAQNGPVDLELPRSYSARLQTGTIHGPSSIEYALESEGRFRGHITTTLGSGGAPIRVVTENGPFHIGAR